MPVASFLERLPNFGDQQFSGVGLEPFLDKRSAQQVIHRGKILVALLSPDRLHVPIAAPPRERRQCLETSSLWIRQCRARKPRHSTLQARATLTMTGLGHFIIALTHGAFSPRDRALTGTALFGSRCGPAP